MRLGTVVLNGAHRTVACMDGGPVHDITDLTDASGLPGILGSGALESLIRGLDAHPTIDTRSATWLPPIPKPERIFCVGLNYGSHATEVLRETAEYPTLFMRLPSSFVGHQVPVVRPAASDTLDWEGEIAIVIGRGGRHISTAEAHHHVAGFSIMAENSVREFQLHSAQATAGKNFDSSGSWGPWIVTGDEVDDFAPLEVVTELNGVQVQHGRLSDLIFDVAHVIAYVSSITRLAPGDVIATGTPSGIGHRQDPPRYLRPGDQLTVRIPGFMELVNTVADEDEAQEVKRPRFDAAPV